jgi:hypothetical protein
MTEPSPNPHPGSILRGRRALVRCVRHLAFQAIFTKGETIRFLRIPHAGFWLDLERLVFEIGRSPTTICSAERG